MDRLPYVATELAAGYDAVGTLPVSVVLHDIRSLYNVGAFFRSADGSASIGWCYPELLVSRPIKKLPKPHSAPNSKWRGTGAVILLRMYKSDKTLATRLLQLKPASMLLIYLIGRPDFLSVSSSGMK